MDYMNDYIAKQTHKFYGQWEKTIKLHVRDKPKYMPKFLWKKILRMVLQQSTYDDFNTIKRDFK